MPALDGVAKGIAGGTGGGPGDFAVVVESNIPLDSLRRHPIRQTLLPDQSFAANLP